MEVGPAGQSGVPVLKVIAVGHDPAHVPNRVTGRAAWETQQKGGAVMRKSSWSIYGDDDYISPSLFTNYSPNTACSSHSLFIYSLKDSSSNGRSFPC